MAKTRRQEDKKTIDLYYNKEGELLSKFREQLIILRDSYQKSNRRMKISEDSRLHKFDRVVHAISASEGFPDARALVERSEVSHVAIAGYIVEIARAIETAGFQKIDSPRKTSTSIAAVRYYLTRIDYKSVCNSM